MLVNIWSLQKISPSKKKRTSRKIEKSWKQKYKVAISKNGGTAGEEGQAVRRRQWKFFEVFLFLHWFWSSKSSDFGQIFELISVFGADTFSFFPNFNRTNATDRSKRQAPDKLWKLPNADASLRWPVSKVYQTACPLRPIRGKREERFTYDCRFLCSPLSFLVVFAFNAQNIL